MHKNYFFLAGLRYLPVLILMVMALSTVHVSAQCNLSLTNSAGGNQPGGTLTVTSSGSTTQRIRWYKDGSLLQTEEATWNPNAVATLLTGPGAQTPKSNVFIPQLSGYKDTVFIADYNNRIWMWWPGLSAPNIILGDAAGSATAVPSGAWAPCYIFIPPSGTDTIFFGEWDGKRVYEWNRRTNQFTQRVGNGYFPTSVAVRNDTVYTTDWHQHVVRRFHRGYVNPGVNVITGATNSRMMFFSGDSMYVVAINSIRKFSATATTTFGTGRLIAGTGVSGPALNQFNDPQHVFLDSIGNLFVADNGNHRIVKWEPGASSGLLVTGDGTSGSAPGQLSAPNKIYISTDGFMYVSDNHNVRQYAHTLVNALAGATPGVYKAVTDGFNGCRDSISITIAAPGPAQPGNFIASKPAVCKGETGVVYRINKVGTATSYNWSYTPAAGVTINTLSDTAVSVDFSGTAASGTLSVVAVNSNGQSLPRDISVTVHNLPVISTISGNSPVCVGATRTLSTTPTGGNWSSGSTGVATIDNSGVVTGASQGSSTITYTYTDVNSCTNTATASVTINALPAVSVSPTGARSICQGDSLLLTATATGVSYQWKEGTTNVGAGASSYYAKANGSYTVTVTNTSTNCSATSSPATTLTVHALPAATVTPAGPITLCEPDSVTFTAGSGTGYSYEWNDGTANVGVGISHTVKTTGNYTVVVTDGATLCRDSVQNISVTVHSLPVAILTPGDTAFCEGGVVTLRVSSADTGLDYRWLRGTSVIPSATADFLDISGTGIYKVAVHRNVLPGCADTTPAVTVTVNPLPTPVAIWDGELFHADPGYVTYQWNTGSQPIVGENDSVFRPSSSGGYSVTVTDSNGCSNISPIVNVNNVNIDPFVKSNNLVNVYPNPANTDVYIQAPVSVNVILTNVEGRKVWSGNGVTKISLDGLPDGVYFLRITDEAGMSLKYEKLIKNGRY